MFSSKKSSAVTSNATTNSLGLNESDNSTAIVGSGNTVMDGGAFDFAKTLVRDSNALQDSVIDRALSSADSVVNKAFSAANESSKSAFNAALQAVQPQPIDLRLVGIAAASVVALFYFASK